MSASTANPESRLAELAHDIERWRKARGWSRNQLCRNISGINDKTFARILAQDFTELKAENHLARYEAARVECDRFDLRVNKEDILADLAPTAAILEACQSIKLNTNNDRVLLIESEGGGGKTEGLRYAALKIDGAVYVAADPRWQTLRGAAGAILTALGITEEDMPVSAGDRLTMIYSRLKARPVLLLIDEYHEAGADVHNLVKGIINHTPGWVALAAASSVWTQVQAKSWAILRQIIHNRMDLRLALPAPDAENVERYLAQRLSLKPPTEKQPGSEQWDAAFAAVVLHAREHGLWAFVRKVAKAAAMQAQVRGKEETAAPAEITAAVAAVLKNTAGLSKRLHSTLPAQGPDAPYPQAA